MDRPTDPTAAGPVVVTIGPAAGDVRRAIGLTAWCALELLAATPAENGEPWVVHSSVRDVAERLGVAPNTAQRALAALRDVGLISAIQGRERAGRFASSAYRLTIDTSVLTRLTREPLMLSTPTRFTQPRVASTPHVIRGQQLSLLPSG
jgi:hypothetical protein